MATESKAKLIQYLNEAYSKEKELETALEAHIPLATRATYRKRLQQHLQETKRHARDVERRIKQLGGNGTAEIAVAVQATAAKALALAQGPLHAVRGTGQQERMLKNARTEYQDEAELLHRELPPRRLGPGAVRVEAVPDAGREGDVGHGTLIGPVQLPKQQHERLNDEALVFHVQAARCDVVVGGVPRHEPVDTRAKDVLRRGDTGVARRGDARALGLDRPGLFSRPPGTTVCFPLSLSQTLPVR